MFTGIIEEVGIVKGIFRGNISIKLEIEAEKVLKDVRIGDSISTDGVCLTVTGFCNNSFTADVMPETMSKTSFFNLKVGSCVNLERALKVGSRFNGHIVSGHIDGTGNIISFKKDDNATWVKISTTDKILKYIVKKGSIAIDGISLTVASVEETTFSVSIIPLTSMETTLLKKQPGDRVNLENDMIGKYVERLLGETTNYKKDISMGFLEQHGYV